MKKRYIKWTMVIIWAIVIFVFSSQPGDISNGNNRFILDMFMKMGINLDAITGNKADFIIRKAAHFTEYFIFYLLLYNALIDDFYLNSTLIISLIMTFLYASTDEFHQRYVSGRGPAVRDVVIDVSGGVVCLLIIYIRHYIRNKKKNYRFFKKPY
ncbi:VanZ family protein [Fonticella tunisiensis]|uniref:VanZ family protein n=1 Tax=Fonticella tunisiensis TaxID=1096341 RepID=A0A4R7K7G8_9CLOT|nr:VanZ family protein [Fonticella tunisiensis]TDT45639.1 VanZ family protein [Fonticella tunisiensis]